MIIIRQSIRAMIITNVHFGKIEYNFNFETRFDNKMVYFATMKTIYHKKIYR